MNGFKIVNQGIRRLEIKIEEQTDGLTETMREIEQIVSKQGQKTNCEHSTSKTMADVK